MIDEKLNPRICDFGLARILLEEGTSGLTTTSEHSGTERYLAYELVVSDDMCVPTLSSDVYALACIGLEVGAHIGSYMPHLTSSRVYSSTATVRAPQEQCARSYISGYPKPGASSASSNFRTQTFRPPMGHI